MPTPGTSLVGFLPQAEAIQLLRNTCVFNDPSDGALTAEWASAAKKLAAATPNAGKPDIQPIIGVGANHVAQLVQQPWLAPLLSGVYAGATFEMVELKPLLAFQFSVDLARSEYHNGNRSSQPTNDELFNMCLPLTPVAEKMPAGYKTANSAALHSRNLNLHLVDGGMFPREDGTYLGIQVGFALPLVHVLRYDGRCFLHNGYHRAVGLARRGVSHAPCIIRDVPDYQAVGIKAEHTFQPAILESSNPPTLGHFVDGRSYDVQLKVFTRILQVSWTDHIITAD